MAPSSLCDTLGTDSAGCPGGGVASLQLAAFKQGRKVSLSNRFFGPPDCSCDFGDGAPFGAAELENGCALRVQ
jgi:hypothetical protein